MLLQLTAGTLFTQTTFGATGFSGTRAWDVNGSLSIHGSRTGNNEFLIDGAPSSGTGGGTGNWNYAPPVDAIEEFKVDTSSVDASYGRTSGGVVNMTLRSGTNQLRGSGIVAAPRHRGSTRTRSRTSATTSRTRAQVRQRRRHGERADPPATRRSSWAAIRASTRTSRSRSTRTVPTEAQLQRRLLADVRPPNGTADHHLRSADDDVQRERQLVHATAVPRQHDPGEPMATRSSKALLPYMPAGRTRRRATCPGIEQLHQLAEPRPLSLQLVPDAHRSHVQRRAPAVVQQQRQLGHRVPQRERAARAGDPQRQLPDAPQPLPASRSTTTTRSARRRCGTRASRGIGSTSRTEGVRPLGDPSRCRSRRPTR